MSDEPINPLVNAIRNTIMRVVFVFFPIFPRNLTRKYKKLGFSPENLVGYITELKALPQFKTLGGPPTLSPAYDLLQGAVRDYQADELRFSSDPVEVSLLRNHEVIIQGTAMYRQQAQARGDNQSRSDCDRQYIDWCRQEMPRIIGFNPVIKHWVFVTKDTSEELVVAIGPIQE